jgi:hypothetical protein
MNPDEFRKWIIVLCAHLLRLIAFVIWAKVPLASHMRHMIQESQKIVEEVTPSDLLLKQNEEDTDGKDS